MLYITALDPLRKELISARSGLSGLGGWMLRHSLWSSAQRITQMSMSNRRVGTYPPALPKSHKGRCGKGAYRLMGLIIFQVNVSFQQGLGFSPLGDRERRAKQRQYPKRSGVVDGRGVGQILDASTLPMVVSTTPIPHPLRCAGAALCNISPGSRYNPG